MNETNEREEPVWFVRLKDSFIRTDSFATEPTLVRRKSKKTCGAFTSLEITGKTFSRRPKVRVNDTS
jgi:hypothetical protein